MTRHSPWTAGSRSSPAPAPASAAPRRWRWPTPAPASCSTTCPARPTRPPRRSASPRRRGRGRRGRRGGAVHRRRDGRRRRRRARRARHRGQQRRHDPRPDAVQPLRRGVGRSSSGCTCAATSCSRATPRRTGAARSKETGAPVYGRVVNTASEAFLGGSPGPGQLRRRQGRHRRAHAVHRPRTRPDRRHAPTRSARGPAPR